MRVRECVVLNFRLRRWRSCVHQWRTFRSKGQMTTGQATGWLASWRAQRLIAVDCRHDGFVCALLLVVGNSPSAAATTTSFVGSCEEESPSREWRARCNPDVLIRDLCCVLFVRSFGSKPPSFEPTPPHQPLQSRRNAFVGICQGSGAVRSAQLGNILGRVRACQAIEATALSISEQVFLSFFRVVMLVVVRPCCRCC